MSNRPAIFRNLVNFLNLNTDEFSVDAIHALVDATKERIDKIELSEIDKGAMISSIISSFIESYKVELTVYNDVSRAFREMKHHTIH